MNRAEAVRLVAALAAVEMSLVRRDAVAGPLLAQAARAADGLECGALVAAARDLMRDAPAGEDDALAAARRKVVQALCRAAAQQAQSAALGGLPDGRARER